MEIPDKLILILDEDDTWSGEFVTDEKDLKTTDTFCRYYRNIREKNSLIQSMNILDTVIRSDTDNDEDFPKKVKSSWSHIKLALIAALDLYKAVEDQNLSTITYQEICTKMSMMKKRINERHI